MNTQTVKNETTTKATKKPSISKEIFKQIEDRNLEIVKCLLEMKYLTAEQIKRKFFSFSKEKANTYLNSCLNKLIDLKFIAKKTYNKFEIYLPTEAAYKYALSKSDGKIISSPNLRVFEPRLNHDLKLCDLRFKLEETKSLRKWYSENMLKEIPKLQESFADLPDAIVTDCDGNSKFLELEISRKTNQKYNERISEYKKILADEHIRSQKIKKVQFVCTDITVFDFLKVLLKDEFQFEVKLYSEYGL